MENKGWNMQGIKEFKGGNTVYGNRAKLSNVGIPNIWPQIVKRMNREPVF